MLHQRTRTRTATAADENLAARRTVACRITGITLYRDRTARVQPADIGRYRTLRYDFRSRQTHGAESLAGIRDMEMQRLALWMPQRAADIVLA